MRALLTLGMLSALLPASVQTAYGQTETVLYSFGEYPDGANPVANPVLGKKKNLYGTTRYGGAYNAGTVFEVTPSGTEKVLHSFEVTGTDGYYPYAGLIVDKKRNLYGTTADGGTIGTNGAGTVFELTPSGTETILHVFQANGTDGYLPSADLVMDKLGNLYGTTYYGGAYGYGTVFELTPTGTETILHSFNYDGTDGYYTQAALALDKHGNLYGTTPAGGAYGFGMVFKLTPTGTETILHSFLPEGTDGCNPLSSPILDKKGNLYGTTQGCGAYGEGTVFKLTPLGSETILYSFGSNGTDGYLPYGSLIFDKKGNLYGTTNSGGAYRFGTVFKLTPSGTETILHSFNPGNGTDGYMPSGDSLLLDKEGNLYGTTALGGGYSCNGNGCGTVYKVTP